MPIKSENKHLYPKNWKELSLKKKVEAGWKCQGIDRYPECSAEHGKPHPVTGSRVVLTLAHLDHDPTNNKPENLRVLCQRCHNTHDHPHRLESRIKRIKETARIKKIAKKCVGDVFHEESLCDPSMTV